LNLQDCFQGGGFGLRFLSELENNVNTCKLTALFFVIVLLAAVPAVAASCESLSNLKLPDTEITSAQTVAPGAFTPPNAGDGPEPAIFKKLPAFCRVMAEIKPAKDSDIKIEVWMPVSGFNGNFRGQGNGGFAGSITYLGMAAAVSRGYATAGTDTGHSASPIDASWARGHPEKIIDFGYRAIHEMTLKAKAVIQAFYGQSPQHSFFAACSNGGRQGLMEAQRFPADYDGIIAGAPANYWTRVFATFIWDIQALQSDPESYIPAKKVPGIDAAVLAACDASDGTKDGIVSQPQSCRFDPAAIACKDAGSDSCLTAKQITALKKIYSGPRDARGKQVFPGFMPGGENGGGGWPLWIIGQAPGKDLQTAFANGFFSNMITTGEPLDLKTASIENALKLADVQQARTFNADDPDLKAFAKRGGKLIVYHGWSDAALPPLATIQYLESVQKAMGQKAADASVRLYMVPGMQHCAGGPGPDSFGQFGGSPASADPEHDIQLAVEQWVEKGIAPDRIIATKYANEPGAPPRVQMTRPLCPYPKMAKYKGTGDTNDAANFVCEAGKK
jgi:Tannase and feruloyl esterase